ncbi:MAG: MmpS family transport accessory protein [Mycobacterium sp.]|nr:MmpS family transport accessory protein [Mycobacterium sp.]
MSGRAGSVGSVAEGSVPAAEPPESELDLPGPESAVAAAPGASRKRRRNFGSSVLGLLAKSWISLTIVVVIAAGAVAVSRLHGIFGSETRPSYGTANPGGGAERATSSQLMRYEVFGPVGTIALISYFDGEGNVKSARGVSLPWSLEFPVTTAASIGSVAAQGDSDSIGCRITIDGVVKAEKISEQVSAFASCVLKAA